MASGLTDHEKFLFDLNGYLVVRGALSADEIGELNAAIDAHSHEAVSRDATDEALGTRQIIGRIAGTGHLYEAQAEAVRQIVRLRIQWRGLPLS